jgi:diguanylate cyclase (GGDEF)-like protein
VNSFLEAQLRVTRIEMAGDRSLLAQLDPQASELRREFPISELQAFTSKCRSALAGWHEAIGNARDQGEYAEKVQQCDQWFQELMQHIQHAEQTLAPASSDSPEVDRDALRKEMHKLFGHVCLLRDRCDELLTRLLRSEKRIEGLHPDEYIDPNSSTLNRLGMERAIKEWTDKDPDRVRMASVILIDVDQCAELNEQHGLKVMDGLLSSLRSLASELIRKDRGFDRVAAIDGQTLLVFLGDTALRNATTGAERIRQTVMSTTFKAEKQQLGLTLSCAVAEWQSNESFDELVMRLRAGLVQAKQAGRNCTTVCTPEEVRVAQCSRMQVASREIAITT